MATWTLADIRQKVRQVTGRLSSNEISNDLLDDYINRFYQYTLPAELKLDKKYTYYEFNTTANQQTYDYPSGYTNFVPPATMDNHSMGWYQSPSQFEKDNPMQVTRGTMWTGDGATVTFSTTVQSFPILPGSTIVTDNTETFTDENQDWTTSTVNLTGSLGGSGTVNYETGAISVTFATAPASSQNIYLSYIVFKAGRPYNILAFNNQFKFFPIPDTVYRFRVPAYAVTSALENGSDVPERPEWGPLIAYGASRDITADKAEMDRYQEITALYKEQINYVMRRTHQSLMNTRSAPMF